MPEWLHRRLNKQANKKGLKGDRKNAYVYGTLSRYEKRKKRDSSFGEGLSGTK